MKFFPAIALAFAVFFSVSVRAQEAPQLDVRALSQVLPGVSEGHLDYDPASGLWTGTNGVIATYGATVLTADAVAVNSKTGDVQADGNVRIESGEELWVGDHINYNFKTRRMQTEQFRTGKMPVLAGGVALDGDVSSHTYNAQSAFVTTDDIDDPAYRVQASHVRIVPGKYVQMWNAVLWADGIPIFYFPYYQRNLGPRANNFMVTPGFRSSYGAFMLGTYTWFLNDAVDGKLHVDYRTKRGPGIGPDVNLHLGQWGELTARYYYLYDVHPVTNVFALPNGFTFPKNRERVYLGWQATPATNLNLKALVNYQTDPLLLHDFFPGEWGANPQPNTFVEANKYSDNWSLDALATPRANNFFNQIERLPEARLTGFRQQVFDTPFYYDSQSSVGWYQAYTANATNGLYSVMNGTNTDTAFRADTYHQITLPWTFFNWLNVAPRIGGRFTYYGERAAGSTTTGDVYRGVFNTGTEISFKSTALWTDAKSSLFDVDGLRHIIEPSVNYIFVPHPSVAPGQLPQFDGEMPALLISPVTFPDYSSIDSIDAMNVIRFGLRNVLQTKRDGQMEDLLNWNLMLDWRLDPQNFPGTSIRQNEWNDLYSQLFFRPRNWLILESQTRFDLEHAKLNLSFHQITFAPNDRWSWGIGHLFLHNAYWGGGNWNGSDYLTSTAFLRLNDNWGLRMQHNFNIQDGRLEQQYYSVYRDLRSFTLAFTFRVEDSENSSPDYTFAVQLSLKAQPMRQTGEDVVNPYRLVGE